LAEDGRAEDDGRRVPAAVCKSRAKYMAFSSGAKIARLPLLSVIQTLLPRNYSGGMMSGGDVLSETPAIGH
jgi:hypothetical protein